MPYMAMMVNALHGYDGQCPMGMTIEANSQCLNPFLTEEKGHFFFF